MLNRHASRCLQPGGDRGPVRGGGLQGAPAPAFKGIKQSLPSKPCMACGRSMGWRKRWARVWHEVKYCSDACRRAKGTGGGP